jgi:hypothetical protein
MKKAKTNIWCDNKQYVAGRIYKNNEVAHLDQNDFEDIEDEIKPVVEVKPVVKAKGRKAKK